jgi:hypothetical protein
MWTVRVCELKHFPYLRHESRGGGRGNTAPLFLRLSTRLKSVVSFPPWPLYPPGKIPANHQIGGCFPSSVNTFFLQAASNLFTIPTELSQFHVRRWNIHCKQGTDVGHSGFTAFALDLVITCHSDTNSNVIFVRSQNCPENFRVCRSVHFHTFEWINQLDATIN